MTSADKPLLYRDLADQLAALLAGESDLIANTANTAALLYHGLPRLNWAGFYFARDTSQSAPSPPPGERAGVRGRIPERLPTDTPLESQSRQLVLGPFQGKPACVRIAWGSGVCGTAAARGATIVVPDVHAFPGHIACDEASRSELVVPLISSGRVVGVLDLDSPDLARFDEQDRVGVEQLVAILLDHHPDWS